MAQRDHGNVGTGTNVVLRGDESWDVFDALPEPIREVLRLAPFNIDDVEIADYLKAGASWGMPLHSLTRDIIKQITNCVLDPRTVAEWGPGYPARPFTPLIPKPRRARVRG